MGDLISPVVMVAIVACIGFCEGLKVKFPKLSTTLTSIIGGAIGAAGMANITGLNILTIQSILLNWFTITCGSWLLYEYVVSRYRVKKDETKQTPTA